MRKAGLARSRSRRKATNGAPNPGAAASTNGPGGPSPTEGQQIVVERRKPTPEEAALTAKNYRLAKELSDLRVRHRDETKTVTRLTMENMNLASRCREAITHVAMLKKELATHQRRAAEALALQRQQSQRSSSLEQPVEPISTLVADESDMNRVVASPPPPPPTPPPKRQQQRVELEHGVQDVQEQESSANANEHSGVPQQDSFPQQPFMSSAGRGVSAATASPAQRQETPAAAASPMPSGGQSDGFESVSNTFGLTRKPAVTQSISVKPTGDDFADEVPADEMRHDEEASGFGNDDFFAAQKHAPLPATPEKEDALSDSADAFAPTAGLGTQIQHHQKRRIQKGVDPEERPPSPVFKRSGMSAMSSIDAFEASFDTTFPTSFSTQKEDPTPSLDIAFDVPEFSDPFYLGSLEGGGGNASFGESPVHSDRSGWKEGKKENGSGGAANSLSAGTETQPLPASAGNRQQRIIVTETSTENNVSDLSPSNELFPSSPMSELTKEMPDQTLSNENANAMGANYARDLFNTPPVAADDFTGPTSSLSSPQAPEKTGAATARAKYDAALGEQVQGSGARQTVDEQAQPQQQSQLSGREGSSGSKKELSNSASLVLKRLQQRRAKDRSNNTPPNGAKMTQSDRATGKPSQDENTATGSKFSPYGVADDKFSGTRRDDSDNVTEARNIVATVNGDYGPKRKTPKAYSSSRGDDSLAMFKATNPIRSVNTKQRVASRLASPTLSPESMSAEMSQLDAIAANATAPSASVPAPAPAPASGSATATSVSTGRRTRSVKQPISYTEPSLNTKIRRGHEFFPKSDGTESADGQGINGRTTRVVSPAPDEKGDRSDAKYGGGDSPQEGIQSQPSAAAVLL